jgi:hypothetical protein
MEIDGFRQVKLWDVRVSVEYKPNDAPHLTIRSMSDSLLAVNRWACETGVTLDFATLMAGGSPQRLPHCVRASSSVFISTTEMAPPTMA